MAAYDVGVPPFPAFIVAVTLPSPPTADTVGVPGIDRGVNESDTAGTGEVLSPIAAVALTVYGVPFARPVTSQSPDAPGTVHAVPATTPAAVYAVTVYDVGVPPVPAATVTVTLVSPATTVGLAGVPGAAMTITPVDPAEKSVVLVALVLVVVVLVVLVLVVLVMVVLVLVVLDLVVLVLVLVVLVP